MIISHRHKFIFLKTNKTAGTSTEIALSTFCGKDDVITPVDSKDEETRRRLGGRGPQNYLAPPWNYGLSDVARLLLKGKRKKRFYNHIPAREVKSHVGRRVWDRYYKFCFERNPWDRVVSLYYWRHKSPPRPTISEFIESGVPLVLKKKGYEVYTIDGRIAVDRVCRYENLSEELESVCKQLGLPEKPDLPEAKSQFRPERLDYRDVLDEKDKAKIAELFREEIRLFGYEF